MLGVSTAAGSMIAAARDFTRRHGNDRDLDSRGDGIPV